MLAAFGEGGYTITEDYSDADVILVNTCAFIKEAKEEAIESILEMAEFKRDGKCRTLAVAGCFSERYRKEAACDLPEVDLWMGVESWPEELSRHLGNKALTSSPRAISDSASQYLKIAEGCSHRCTFCVIPSIRGSFRSRPVNEIVEEALWLYEQGARECILVSQDTAFYGRDENRTLTDLVEKLLEKTAFPWIRLMYLNPQYVDDSLLHLIASEPRLCSYFDVPMQHASDKILKAMRRPTSSADLRNTVERIRTIVPGAALRSSFILGFPGETERDFRQLVSFIEWARFDKLGVFPYSPEEGTAAYEMRPRPRTGTVMRRCEQIMDIQRTISSEALEGRRNSIMKVLVEHPTDGDTDGFEGRSEFDAPEVDGRVFVLTSSADIGEFMEVKVFDSDDYDLYAKPITKCP